MTSTSGVKPAAPCLIQDLRFGIERYRKTTEHLDKEQSALDGSAKEWKKWSTQWNPKWIASMKDTTIKALMYAAANTYRGYRLTKAETVKGTLDSLGALAKTTTPDEFSPEVRAKLEKSYYNLKPFDVGAELRGKMLRCLSVMDSEIQSKLKTFEATTNTAAADLDVALTNARTQYKMPTYSRLMGYFNKAGLDDTIDELKDKNKRDPKGVVDYETLDAQFAEKTKIAKELETPTALKQKETRYTPEEAVIELQTILEELEKISDETVPIPSVPAKPPGSALPLPVTSPAAPDASGVVGSQTDPAKVGDKPETPAPAPADGSVSAAKEELPVAAPGSTTPAAQPEVSSGSAVQTGTVPSATADKPSANEPAPMNAVTEEQGGDAEEQFVVHDSTGQSPASSTVARPSSPKWAEKAATPAAAAATKGPTKPPIPRVGSSSAPATGAPVVSGDNKGKKSDAA